MCICLKKVPGPFLPHIIPRGTDSFSSHACSLYAAVVMGENRSSPSWSLLCAGEGRTDSKQGNGSVKESESLIHAMEKKKVNLDSDIVSEDGAGMA